MKFLAKNRLVFISYIALALTCAVLLFLRGESRLERWKVIGQIEKGDSLSEIQSIFAPLGGTANQVRKGYTAIDFRPRHGLNLRISHIGDAIDTYTLQDGSSAATGPPIPWSTDSSSSSNRMMAGVFMFFLSLIFWLPSALAFSLRRKTLPLLATLVLIMNGFVALAFYAKFQ